MNRRIALTALGVAGVAIALSLGSAVFSGNEMRAEGAQVKETTGGTAEPARATAAPASEAPVAPTAGVSVSGPSTATPVPPPATYQPPASAITEARDGSVAIQEIFQLRALKRRIGGENLKRLIDALAD